MKLFAQDFWQRSVFPAFYAGEISAIDAKNNLVLASSYSNGLGLSTDCGEHWMLTGILQPYSSVAVSNSGYLFAIGNNGVLYRSTDTGNKWLQCSDEIFYNGQITISKNNDFIYANTSFDGIYRSTDMGETWTFKNNGLGTFSWVNKIVVSSNGILVVATSSGIFKSTNNADSWIQISTMGATNYAINSLGYIFADKYNSEPYYYSPILYRSTDNGTSWHELMQQWYGSCLFINPVNDEIITASFNYTQDYSLSTDNGLTWNTITIEKSPKCMTYNYNGSFLMGTIRSGIFKSNSLSGPWQSSNVDFPGSFSQVTSVLCYGGTIYAGTGSFGLYSSSDNGISFNRLAANLLSIIKMSATSNGNLFVVNGTIIRSTDNGNSWFDYPTPGALYDLITSSLCSQGSTVMTGGYHSDEGAELDRSTDNGDTWNEVFTIPGNYAYQERKSVICLAIHNDGIVLGCVENRKNNSYNYGIIRSSNYGLSWDTVSTNLLQVPEIRDFIWNFNNLVFAASSQGLLQSTDNGLSWFYTNGVLPTNDIRALVINSNNSIYVGTGNKGVFRSTDDGVTWNNLNVGISDTVVNTLSISSEGYLFAGTEHDGVFRSTEPITSVKNENEVRFGTYNLYQNYPNPFNPTTKIEYSIPASLNPSKGGTFVTLKVFNVLGREVATLVNKEKPSGNYEVEFDGKEIPSGIYFYELQAGDYFETKKMTLIR